MPPAYAHDLFRREVLAATRRRFRGGAGCAGMDVRWRRGGRVLSRRSEGAQLERRDGMEAQLEPPARRGRGGGDRSRRRRVAGFSRRPPSRCHGSGGARENPTLASAARTALARVEGQRRRARARRGPGARRKDRRGAARRGHGHDRERRDARERAEGPARGDQSGEGPHGRAGDAAAARAAAGAREAREDAWCRRRRGPRSRSPPRARSPRPRTVPAPPLPRAVLFAAGAARPRRRRRVAPDRGGVAPAAAAIEATHARLRAGPFPEMQGGPLLLLKASVLILGGFAPVSLFGQRGRA